MLVHNQTSSMITLAKLTRGGPVLVCPLNPVVVSGSLRCPTNAVLTPTLPIIEAELPSLGVLGKRREGSKANQAMEGGCVKLGWKPRGCGNSLTPETGKKTISSANVMLVHSPSLRLSRGVGRSERPGDRPNLWPRSIISSGGCRRSVNPQTRGPPSLQPRGAVLRRCHSNLPQRSRLPTWK
ncbi:hypothetical protein BO85DRAFT_19892 [Aspergillus piperis CBS 112811]|uniref:Uncharacterized protein n=1 Tax=Aspergillus piperis CBS 112811 TaxID=1448313 RepID=A0A8G1RCP2_9EURO|nr:hypothetical protein BO85DRAFT_19892 [Aspergillus piperis CBS 112811]RAH63242.1 hypothetical protein BO85DRAFT_19892 [Aspergillus piperis CBS 112811]